MILAPACQQEHTMSTPFNISPFSLFAPGNLSQAINPGWFDINVTYQGNPAIEKEVVEKVASFGKQLGLITDVVLQLAAARPDGDKKDPLRRLREIAKEIEKLKAANEASLSGRAQDAMDQLARTYPAVAHLIAKKYAHKPPE
jgi:hypothetical protein